MTLTAALIASLTIPLSGQATAPRSKEDVRNVIRLARAYVVQHPALAQGLVNQVGYDQLSRGQVDRAVQTFKNNAEAFPDSPNVHDSLGDAYCRAGDNASAKRSYEQAAHVAETRSPPHPRLNWYREKAKKGCTP
jgi:Tfp pilus assembly protein PilF